MVRRKPVSETRTERLAIEFSDGLRRAENGTAQRMLRPEAARENIVKEIFGIIQVHLDFFEDDLALFFYVIGVEFWPENQIRDDVKGDGQVLVKNLSVEADLLLGSKRVKHAADGIHFAGDGFSGAAFRALENHVLDEVREAVFLENFAAGTIANPNADRNGANVGHRLCEDHEAVRQNVLLNVARFSRHT